MNKKKFLIVGSGGRESAFALRLSEDSVLFAIMTHKNPSIVDCVEKTKGKFLIADTNNGQLILKFAKENHIDYVFVSADEPLSNGVVDVLLEGGIKAIGGTREANRIEWDKVYSINMMNKLCPNFTPFYRVVSDEKKLQVAIEEFKKRSLEIVVKPQGLTGGKGVKVMPVHLQSYQDCFEYASELLTQKPGQEILLVERLQGIEFTIMGITDGKNLVLSPASYDYPFRYENDTGPGTGGMGCFTHSDKKLPFMNAHDLEDCRLIMQRTVDELRKKNLFFNGVINGGFFKTENGIQFMEFNSRFGDPEGLNILSVIESSFSQLLIDIWNKELSENKVKFKNESSVIKYLVVKEYPNVAKEAIEFSVDKEAIESMGIKLYFASCIHLKDNQYQTLKKSRVLALGALSKKIEDAADLINQAIEKYIVGGLEYRKDIGSEKDLAKIAKFNSTIQTHPHPKDALPLFSSLQIDSQSS